MRYLWIFLTLPVLFGIAVSSAAQDPSQYFDTENFQFGLDRALFQNELMDAGFVTYPAGVRQLIASLPVRNIPEGALLEIRWFHDGEPETETEGFLYTGADNLVTALSNASGLPAGIYTYQVRWDNLVFEQSVILVEEPYIYPFRFGKDCTVYSSEVLGYPTERYFAADINIAMQVRFANFLPDTGIRWQVLRNGLPTEVQVERAYNGTGYFCYNYFNIEQGLGTALYEFLLIDTRTGVEIHREAVVVAG